MLARSGGRFALACARAVSRPPPAPLARAHAGYSPRLVHSSSATPDYDLLPDVKFVIQLMATRHPDMTHKQIAERLNVLEGEVRAVLEPLPQRFQYPEMPEPHQEPHLELSPDSKRAERGVRNFRFAFAEIGKDVDNSNRRIAVRDVNNELRAPTLAEFELTQRRHESFATHAKRRSLRHQYVQDLIKRESPLVMTEFNEHEERRKGWRLGGLSPPVCLEPETAKNLANVSLINDDVLELWDTYLDDPDYDSDGDMDGYYPV